MKRDFDETMVFKSAGDEQVVLEILSSVFQALKEKGYDPVNQIVGYLISGDPTYITSYQNARGMIARLERDEILEHVIKYYLSGNNLSG